MRYLIFGGSGYLGSHLTLQLLVAGHELVNFDNQSGHLVTVFKPNVITIQGDITSTADLSKLEKYGKFDGVFHLAAKKSVSESITHPNLYMQVNVTGTKKIIDFCIDNQIKNIVFTSSAAVYGDGVTTKIDENSEKVPMNPYGKSKLLSEAILEDHCLKYGISSVALRSFNIVGAAKQDYYDDQGENVIPIITRSLKNKHIFRIFGGDFDTKDGTCVRDYVNVSDVASAHTSAMSYLEKQPAGMYKSINVCSGSGTSMLELVQIVNNNSKIQLDWIIGDRRIGDPASVVGNNDLANKLLGWRPSVAIEQSIKESLNA